MEKVTAEWLFEAMVQGNDKPYPELAKAYRIAGMGEPMQFDYEIIADAINRREQELRDEIIGLRNKLGAVRKLAAKYAAATEYHDELICGGWTALSPHAKKCVNDVGKTILRALSSETE